MQVSQKLVIPLRGVLLISRWKISVLFKKQTPKNWKKLTNHSFVWRPLQINGWHVAPPSKQKLTALINAEWFAVHKVPLQLLQKRWFTSMAEIKVKSLCLSTQISYNLLYSRCSKVKIYMHMLCMQRLHREGKQHEGLVASGQLAMEFLAFLLIQVFLYRHSESQFGEASL